MKKRKIGVFQFLAFLPQVLLPTGLYLAGDKNILSIKDFAGEYVAYRVPSDTKGGTITINENTDTPLFVYVNSNKNKFEEKMNPPASEELTIERDYVSLSDKRLLGIIHYLFTTNMPNRRIKLSDTANIMSLIDEAILIRTGNTSKYTLQPNKWNGIKELLDEAIMTKEIDIQQAKTSVVPIQVTNNSNSPE